MKKTIMLLLVLTFSAALVYAGTGNLIVNNWLGVGGVTTPQHAVDVVGDVNITGNYLINGLKALTGPISGLTITNDGTNPNTQIDVTANFIGTAAPSGTIGINCAVAGQAAGNDLDTGTLAANTWYYIWAIINSTTLAGLASTSATSPQMPANYTTNSSKRLIGVARTNGTGNFWVFVQQGNHWVYDQYQQVSTGTAAQSWQAQNCATFIPPVSTRGVFQVLCNNATACTCALRKNGSVSTLGHNMGNVVPGATYSTVVDTVDTDASQIVQLYTSVTSVSWHLYVLGFDLNL